MVQAQSALAAAESKLHTSHQSLDQLTAQLEQANATLAAQQSSLTASIRSGDATCNKFGDSSAECQSARSNTYGMQPQILQAEQQVKLLSGNGSWDQLAAQKDVVAAQAAYDAAAASLKQTAAAHSVAGRPDRRPDRVRLGPVAAHQRAGQARPDPRRSDQRRPDRRRRARSTRPTPAW